MDPYEVLRNKMVDLYVAGRGITDRRVLDAMRKIPRHIFVDPALAHRAYEDYAAPIGSGQTMSQPYTVALLAQTAALKGNEKILEVGTGSGYQAAVLSELVERVYTVERLKQLSNRARKLFNDIHRKNIVCLAGDGTIGSAAYAPYDAIVVTASSPKIPVPLVKQLVDGGRMVIPVESGGEQAIHLITRRGERFVVKKIEKCSFVPLLGKHGWAKKPAVR